MHPLACVLQYHPNMNKLPGDWTTRGTVIIESSEISYGANELSRVEILRDVARMIQAGQTVVSCAMVTDARRAMTDAYRTSLVIRAEHRRRRTVPLS